MEDVLLRVPFGRMKEVEPLAEVRVGGSWLKVSWSLWYDPR